MNPSTGTFTTMDTYQGSVFDPVSLHKYLYANANPVMNSDPSGYNTLPDLQAGEAGSVPLKEANAISSQFAMTVWRSVISGAVFAGLDAYRQWRTTGKIDWGHVFDTFVITSAASVFFGVSYILGSAMQSTMILTALGGSSVIFAGAGLAQAVADGRAGKFDLALIDLVFAGAAVKGAKSCYDSTVKIASAKNTAETVTVPTPENSNTAKSSASFTFNESGRKIDISRWHSSENGAWKPLKGGGGKGLGRVAPDQVEPGIRYLEGQYIRDGGNGTGRVEPWKAYYDEYGRLYARTDYNAADPSKGITATHHHLPIWTRGGKYGEKIHYEGEYKP